MNTTKNTFILSLLLLVGTVLFLGGCGPENLDDPAYLAQLAESEMINDAADKDAEGNPMKEQDQQGEEDQKQGMQAQGGADQQMAGGPQGGMVGGPGPVAGVAAVAAVPVVPVIELPPIFVEEPPIAVENPLIHTTTGEHHALNQRVIHRQRNFENQPHLNTHVITSSKNTHHVFAPELIKTHTFANEVVGQPTIFTETTEVLPTVVVEAPPVVVPPILAPLPPPIPPCNPYFRPFCRPLVAGPYLR